MDYSTIHPEIWTGETGSKLHGDEGAQVLMAYLLTCGHRNQLGLYYLPFAYVTVDIGMGTDRVSEKMARLCSPEIGFCKYDHQRKLVWVIKMAPGQITRSPKAREGAVRILAKTKDSPLKSELVALYGSDLSRLHTVAIPYPTTADRVSLPDPQLAPIQGQDKTEQTKTEPPFPPEGGGVGPDGSKSQPPEPVTGVQPARARSSSADQEVHEAFKTTWDQAHEAAPTMVGKTMPQFLPSVWKGAVEHCRNVARDYSKSLYEAASDVAKAAKPGATGWNIDCSKVDPYVKPKPASGRPGRFVERGPNTTGKDFANVEPIEVQLARIGRTV